MRAIVRPGLLAMTATGLLTAALSTHAQAPKTTAAPPAAKRVVPTRPANADQVLATVNGEKVTRGELLDFLNRYEIPEGDQQQIYRDAVETLINTHLISQYLNRQNIRVPEERIQQELNTLDKQLKADGGSLAQALVESNKSMDEVRNEFANRIRWIEYVKLRGTDAELKKFAETHKDLLSGTQVRASHILLRIDPKATPADKEKIRQKLLGLKRDIETKKITFAEAANKYSEDPANKSGQDPAKTEYAGGDIGYFGLKSGIVEEFGKAAFALKPGQISEPVETPYGYHLIMVTDRQERPKIDFEQNKPLILNEYAAELQRDLLTAQRKTAKIDIKPMPADLFPLASAVAPVPTPAAGAPAAGAPAGQPKSANPARPQVK